MIEVRRVLTQVEDIHHEFGPPPPARLRRGAVCAVLGNPYAGRYHADIVPMMEALTPVGVALAKALRAAMDVPAERIEGYGKGAIVGAAGELEHGALWHVPGGYAMRDLLGDALAIVPATKKVGAPGVTLDVPLTHINASYVRSHFDAIEVRVPGAPAADELVLVLAMATGPRIHHRVGGLAADAISKWDGLR